MEVNDHAKTKGNVFGTILLIGGSCIGAGMLGLPVLSSMAGFLPSTLMIGVSCLFMISTGLLLLEAVLAFEGDINLITMTERTLGKRAKVLVFFFFGFLFYSIMVAYSSGSGALFSDFCEKVFGIRPNEYVGGGIFNLLFGWGVFIGTSVVDRLNRVLMIGLIVSYCVLVSLGISFIELKKLEEVHWNKALLTLPVLIISFGYHNLVPSLTLYLGRNTKKIVIAIILGSLIPLCVYALWNFLILGIINEEQFKESASKGTLVTHAFSEITGNPLVGSMAEFFAFFAIVTSFIGVALSFVDFLRDAFSLEKTKKTRFFATLFALLPPYLFSIVYPGIFLKALDVAGGFGAVILFGIIPALMVWTGRYRKKLWKKTLLPLGKLGLILVILFSLLVFSVELYITLFEGKKI